jgi:hypothetical protein
VLLRRPDASSTIRCGMRPTFADPKTAFVFKRIFGTEEH